MYRISAGILEQSVWGLNEPRRNRVGVPARQSFRLAVKDCSKILAQEEGEKKEDQIF
jgi:hypothetical protein